MQKRPEVTHEQWASHSSAFPCRPLPLPRARVIPFRTPLMAWFGILFQFIGLSTLSESFFFFSGRPGANAGTAIGYHHHHPRSRQ